MMAQPGLIAFQYNRVLYKAAGRPEPKHGLLYEKLGISCTCNGEIARKWGNYEGMLQVDVTSIRATLRLPRERASTRLSPCIKHE